MALFLLEYGSTAGTRDELKPLFKRVAKAVEQAGGAFIEAQVPTELDRAYIVVEHTDEASLQRALEAGEVAPRGVAQVRLVGASLEDVKAAQAPAEYLVEWDFPAGLTMDVYLERKKSKAPLYAQVPEVRFLRTYVCEDMSKCLCFYQAPDASAVRRAREVVSTPVDRLSPLAGTESASAVVGASRGGAA